MSLLTSAPTTYRFEVIDTGPGIPTEAQAQLFQPFQQGGAGIRKGGTGLGLVISKRQIELMGGELQLDSAPGRGSCFHFQIPLPPATGAARTASAETRPILRLARGHAVKALIVDDVPENRDVLSQMLGSIGAQVEVVASGPAALDWLRECANPVGGNAASAAPSSPREGRAGRGTRRGELHDNEPPLPSPLLHPLEEREKAGSRNQSAAAAGLPDMIFMDIRMPGMDGKETARRIWEEFGRGRMKLVALSASVLEHERQEYLAIGFDDFIGKPFRFDQVCDCLRRHLHVEFEFGDAPSAPGANAPALDPARVTLPPKLLDQLREAAERYNVTRLEQSLSELEKNGPQNRAVAGHLRRLIDAGHLNAVAQFLNQVPRG